MPRRKFVLWDRAPGGRGRGGSLASLRSAAGPAPPPPTLARPRPSHPASRSHKTNFRGGIFCGHRDRLKSILYVILHHRPDVFASQTRLEARKRGWRSFSDLQPRFYFLKIVYIRSSNTTFLTSPTIRRRGVVV